MNNDKPREWFLFQESLDYMPSVHTGPLLERQTGVKVIEYSAYAELELSAESHRGLLRETLAYFDKRLENFSGGEYRLAESDLLERIRQALEEAEDGN